MDTVLDFLVLTHDGQVVTFLIIIVASCITALFIERLDIQIKRKMSLLKCRARRFLPAYRLCRAQMQFLKKKRRAVALEGVRLILAFLRG